MRETRATHNLCAVSANTKETAVNTEQTADTTLLCDLGDVTQLEPRRETNANQATGKEEPDLIYDLGKTATRPFNFNMAQAQHFGFLLAFGLGSASAATRGDGHRHTILPISGDLDASRSNPTFTLIDQLGGGILKRRFASFAVNSVEAAFAADDWVKIKGEAVGTGKVTLNAVEETITAAENATSLTLAANAVQGSTAAARLDNVHQVRVELSAGVWTEVAFSAVSAATPAVITITAPGVAATSRSYKVLYLPAAAAWETFPAEVQESPLRVSQMTLVVGGAWTGSAFSGGRTLTAELNSITYKLLNGMAARFVPGQTGAYAGRLVRGGRTQTIALDREFREYIMQNYLDKNETFGLRILCEGDLYDSTYTYAVELIFPMLGILKAPLSVKDKLVAEAGDLQVLEHDTYGSIIVHVDNLVATYAA